MRGLTKLFGRLFDGSIAFGVMFTNFKWLFYFGVVAAILATVNTTLALLFTSAPDNGLVQAGLSLMPTTGTTALSIIVAHNVTIAVFNLKKAVILHTFFR